MEFGKHFVMDVQDLDYYKVNLHDYEACKKQNRNVIFSKDL
jgi:hypothetical protein